ncbi:uncharacterized protein PG998_006209 [Apiospora kogelbergensis]|uniref:uncharacterized protein n=1 Tax=Apiospora kogelbergensis TaxID=1337665 RepID=UPI00313080AD
MSVVTEAPTMFFTLLPREVIALIMIEVVHVRGIKRAQRLRYVSKAWDEAIKRAIVESGMLDGRHIIRQSGCWAYQIAYRALHDSTLVQNGQVPMHLYIIRLVAERVTRHANSNINSNTFLRSEIATLKGSLDTICAMRQTPLHGLGETTSKDLLGIDIPLSQHLTPMMRNHYDEVLLGTAA